jgi:type IV secretory pathway VirD2 relaxase
VAKSARIGSKLQQQIDAEAALHDREEERSLGIGRPSAARIVNRVHRERAGVGVGRLLGGLSRSSPISKSRPLRLVPKTHPQSRRVTVKVNYVQNRKLGQWLAHGKYLQREGAQVEGGMGYGFSATGDKLDMCHHLHQWQEADDHDMFKIMISPEDGSRLALKDYTREYMSELSKHLGRDLEWVAIDHHNTSMDHVHVALRANNNLFISPELIRNGMRSIGSDIATQRLGYRTDKEILAGKEREVTQARFTGLDRDIASRQLSGPDVLGHDGGKTYITESLQSEHKEMVSRRLRVGRLNKLVELGVAEKVGVMTWALDAGWDKALRDLETLRTRSKMVSEAKAMMTEPRALPVVTRIQSGDRLVGRVLGTGLDESNNRSYIMLEGMDNRAHIVYQSSAVEKLRAEQKLQPTDFVAIEGRSFEKDGRSVVYQKVLDYGFKVPDKGWKSVKVPDNALDDELGHLKAKNLNIDENMTTGFAAEWTRQLLARKRKKELELKGIPSTLSQATTLSPAPQGKVATKEVLPSTLSQATALSPATKEVLPSKEVKPRGLGS